MKRILLAVGFGVAALGFLGSFWALTFSVDPVTGEPFRTLPRDVLYQFTTGFAGLLMAAGVALFLPLDWRMLADPKTPAERIAAVACLTALWIAILMVMGRH